MFRFAILAVAILFASTANAQRVFHASIDLGDTETLVVVVKPVETVKLKPKPKLAVSNRYSQAELIGIVQAAYPNGNYTRYADVQPRSGVWRHLQDSNHRFTADQVSGLPQDIALGLHGLHHANLIRATRGASKAAATVAGSQPAKIVQAAGGCPNGQCARQSQSQPARQQQFRTFRLFR